MVAELGKATQNARWSFQREETEQTAEGIFEAFNQSPQEKKESEEMIFKVKMTEFPKTDHSQYIPRLKTPTESQAM